MGQWLGSLMRMVAAAVIGMPTQQEAVLDDLILRLRALQEWDNKILEKLNKLEMEIIERNAMDDDPKFRTESKGERTNEMVEKLNTISIELAERNAVWANVKRDLAKFKHMLKSNCHFDLRDWES